MQASTLGVLISAVCLVAAVQPDRRLLQVRKVFVSGNNQAAEKARETLLGGKTCLALADKAEAADAVLELSAETQNQLGTLGSLGGRNWMASATLTLKTGELVWSKSERWQDAPFKSGGKTAGDLLVRRLAREAGCKGRQRPGPKT